MIEISDESVLKINIEREIPFFGFGDSLENRLRKVSLRGFPNIKIYKNAVFELSTLTSKDIIKKLYTPQPTVYRTHLNRIKVLHDLFKEQGIDILNLNKAYDFISISEGETETEWTILPPIVERFFIPRTPDRKLDYESLIGMEVIELLNKQDLWLNPELQKISYTSKTNMYNLINDGSHRIHYGFENGGIKIITAESMIKGFPYYAAPQPYSSVKIVPERNQKAIEMKVHVLEDPAHKSLYRLFPSGGIKSGDIRPEKVK